MPLEDEDINKQCTTLTRWNPMFINDVYSIVFSDSISKEIGFWFGHPICWIQVVGYVVSLDFYEDKYVCTVDDCTSQNIRTVFSLKERRSLAQKAKRLNPGSIVRVGGKIQRVHSFHLLAYTLDLLEDPNAEWKEWLKRIHYRQKLQRKQSILKEKPVNEKLGFPCKSSHSSNHAKVLLHHLRRLCKANPEAGFTIEEVIGFFKINNLSLPSVSVINVESQRIDTLPGINDEAIRLSLLSLLRHGRVIYKKPDSVYRLFFGKDVIKYVMPMMSSGRVEAHRVLDVLRQADVSFQTVPIYAIAKHIRKFLRSARSSWDETEKYVWELNNRKHGFLPI
ncbi:telomere cap complex subunit Stn1 [Schizosaccharomyces cryophilus OY26]|uniref:Telomere cap complex subunit Stn1 n=1 Tax=Schizosaccharomyces cryophilus (strain OY26 / ATCC MYA-4695 / CBS 11777 / NBRC 106824 / NRRL Y48691) TaxID=653667 RepID=S9VTJ5_SCHCR|nr:telomere cap complex subunit Stn1 [Schizosaccharomyces cryophilus OY26]EPY49365.1 telomere cap complex subunit Stn1 [Schizosaccharomyces cryophilus OY26]